MADYFQHWIDMGKLIKNPPKIFNVNWFRLDTEGHFIWPGFGDNLRILEWIIKRCSDEVGARETVMGYLPRAQDLNLEGLDVDHDAVDSILKVDISNLTHEIPGIREFYEQFGDNLPEELTHYLNALEEFIESYK